MTLNFPSRFDHTSIHWDFRPVRFVWADQQLGGSSLVVRLPFSPKGALHSAVSETRYTIRRGLLKSNSFDIGIAPLYVAAHNTAPPGVHQQLEELPF